LKKRSRKLISILLTLALLATLLVPMATPTFAASTNVALTVPNITVANGQSLGTIRVTESTIGSVYAAAGIPTEITVTLPSGMTYATTPTVTAGYVNVPAKVGTTDNRLAAADVVFRAGTSRSITVQVVGATGLATGTAMIEFLFNGASQVNVSSGSGDVSVNIFEPTGAITSGDAVNAKIVSATTTATALGAPSRTEGTNRVIGDIRIVENSVGALTATASSIDLVLPQGYTWNTLGAGQIVLSGGFAGGSITANAANTTASGLSRVQLNVVAASTGQPGVITITGATADVNNTAAIGDCVLSLGGNNAGISAASLTVAKKVEFGATVSAASTPVVYAGANAGDIGAIEIKESAAGSVLATRTIRLTLPENAAWDTVPAVRVTSGNIVVAAGAVVAGTNNRTISYTVTTASTSTATFLLERGAIDVQPNATAGDVNVEVAGTASVTGTAKVAEIKAPITASSDPISVKIGLQSQDAADILIKEVAAGTIKATDNLGASRNLELYAPAGVTFAATPKVEVAEGNLVVDTLNVTRRGGNAVVTIPLKASSTTASTIKISGIKLTVNRDVPEGNVTMAVRGNAVDLVNNPIAGAAAVNAAGVAPATVITAAPVETKASSSFVIGSTTYKVGGVEKTMDVAPYIKNGRTYLPVRYVAQSLGVDDANILWDEATGKVTLLKGDKVVQVTIGSADMIVNGVTIKMDVAAEITDGRTMLPFRFIAQALGATVGWDEATQTVTLK